MAAWMVWAAMAACLVGLALGLVGLLAPRVAARIVRLQADPAFPDGVAEFRASFGGLFAAVHGLCLFGLVQVLGDLNWIAPSAMLCGATAMVWLGTAFGRLVALIADRPARTLYQAAAVGFEVVLGLALAAPFWSLQTL